MDGIFGLHGEDEDEDEDKDEDDDEDEDEFDSEEFDAMAPPKEPSVIIEDITDKEEVRWQAGQLLLNARHAATGWMTCKHWTCVCLLRQP